MVQVIYKAGDDVSTDLIYPGRFMATVLPSETPQFAFADDTDFNAKLKSELVSPGSVLLGGHNFGCGSSREQAVSCLKGHELVVIAKSFARIFLQNAINLGLRVITCPTLNANEGDTLEWTSHEVVNCTQEKRFAIVPLPKSRQSIIDAGGLIAYTHQRLLEKTAG